MHPLVSYIYIFHKYNNTPCHQQCITFQTDVLVMLIVLLINMKEPDQGTAS